MKYSSKASLLTDISREYQSLLDSLDRIPERFYLEPGVWGDNWSIRDLVAHLHGWHRLFLSWWKAGTLGEIPALPAPGFKWSQTPALNRDIQRRYEGEPAAEIRRLLEASHRAIVRIAASLDERTLLQPGHFSWTGGNPLVTYLAANTASHYRFAERVLARWQRKTAGASQDRSSLE